MGGERRSGADSVLADRRLVIAALGVVVVLPLCFPRDLGALSWVSAAAVRPARTCSAPREGRRVSL